MSKRLFSIIALVMLLTVPVMASPLSSVLEWISAQTGLTDQVVGWIGGILLAPALTWLTKKLDFPALEKSVDSLIDTWKRSSYVYVYGVFQGLNDLILKIPLLGISWEKFIEPVFIKAVSGIARLLARIVMGIANIILELALAVSAGLNSRGESLVKK